MATKSELSVLKRVGRGWGELYRAMFGRVAAT